MANSGVRFIVSEYHIAWDALTHYESYLAGRSSAADDGDERVKYDQLLQDVHSAKRSLAAAAQNDFRLNLGQ
jgi:hypothetical protein